MKYINQFGAGYIPLPTMKELPLEIWIYIAAFIPDATLRGLFGVNLFFYNISMNLRYKSIALQRFTSRTVKLLSRLADPAAGRRVRFLTASPDFQFYGAVRRPPSFSDRILYHVLHFRLSGTGPMNDHIPRPEEEGTLALIDALPAMSNVMAFTIDSHSWGRHSGPELNIFLNTAWASFGSNLKKLSLRGHAASFRTIITSKPTLPMVEELFFELIDSPSSSLDMQEVANTLLTVFAPFINSFAIRLQALTFWAWTSLELSALFKALAYFPMLTCFNLQTSFPRTFKDDTSSLSDFLRRHRAQLEILVLRLNTVPLLRAIPLEQPLSEWMLNTFKDNHFSHLQELQLYPSALPKGFEALLTCIQLSAGTLHRLVVRERYLDPEDVLKLLDVIPPNLQSLRLNIRELDVELFVILAIRLPKLRSLSLYIGEVSPSSATFISEMKARTFAGWKLCNIGIWRGGFIASPQLMHTIRRSIPTVDSFWGLGSTYTDTAIEQPIDWSTRHVDDGIL
ncbi:hypothetical protein J3R30DRAFT_194948 [Lentinula aciculospora]|uniref:F-box domain-containing protein n=1 Tax=Lentinula aciculospora TaxID=153920 RepID=A0A9W9DM53_9AGAR|nr:hypothetical protein J3R30DRAFT_194948 [Lentinula aciculospora]